MYRYEGELFSEQEFGMRVLREEKKKRIYIFASIPVSYLVESTAYIYYGAGTS